MRHYIEVTPDKKLEVTIYPTDLMHEVGVGIRVDKQEARNLAELLLEKLKELDTREADGQ